MNKFFKLAAITAFAVCSLQVHADPIIDTFATAQAVADTSTNGTAVTSSIVLPAADSSLLTAPITRTLSADKKGQAAEDINNQGVRLSVNASTKRLAFSQDADQWGQGLASWEGATPVTSILDLSTLNPTSKFAYTYRADGALQVDIIVTDVLGGTSLATFFTTNTGGGFINDFILLSDLGTNLLDFNIAKIEVLFNVNSSAATADIDLTLSQVRLVPEPATLVLSGLALLGLGAVRRRKA